MYLILQKIIQNSSEPELIEKAFEFAKEAHQDQKRLSGKDYISHPLRVAEILSELQLDAKTITAGLLHDVADDTERSLKDIEKEFDKEVAFLVDGVSKLGKLRYPQEKIKIKSPESRVEEPVDLQVENLRKMFFAMAKDLRVVLIKLADRLHNMETLASVPLEKQKRIALETLEIFAPLADRLGMGDMKNKLEDLAFPYLYRQEYQWLIKNVKEKREEREKHLKKIKPQLMKILKREGIKMIEIHSRPKHYWSLFQKLLKYQRDFDRIYDLIALRVVVDDVKTCYQALGAIHKFWKPLPGRIKDYIATPKPNGYQAIHTTVICACPQGEIIEIQIKTKAMHQDAEYGIAAHWAIKEGINLKSQRRKFAWVQQLRDWRNKILGLTQSTQNQKDKTAWLQELKDWQNKISEPGEFLEGLKIDFFKKRIFVFTPKGDVIDLPEGACPIDFAYAVHSDIGNHCAGAKANNKIIALSQPLKNGDVVEIIVDKKKKPSRDWLKFIKTGLAKSRIKSEFKKATPSPEPVKTLLKARQAQPTIHWEKIKKEERAIFLAGEKGIQVYLAQCCQPQPADKIQAYVTRDHGAAVHKLNCDNLTKVQKKWPQRIIDASWENR